MENLIGLKDLRENVTTYSKKVAKGESFIVLKKSKPIFRISPIDSDEWEEIVDFTKIQKGGVSVKELLSRL